MSASLPIVYLSSNTQLKSNYEYHTDTSLSSFVVTLPSAPLDGAIILISDITRTWSTNSLTVLTSGSDSINGSSSLFLTANGAVFNFWYLAANKEWVYFYEQKLDPNIVSAVVSSNPKLTTSLVNNKLSLDLEGLFDPQFGALTPGDVLTYISDGWTNTSLSGAVSNILQSQKSTIDIAYQSDKINIDVHSGRLSEQVSDVLTITNGDASILKDVTIEVAKASASQDGYLSKSDWTSFNMKQEPHDDYLRGKGVRDEVAIFTDSHTVEGYVANSAFNASFSDDASVYQMDGIRSPGVSSLVARADHVHPSDTTKQNLAVPAAPGDVALLDANGQVYDSQVAISRDYSSSSTSAVLTASAVQEAIDAKIRGALVIQGTWDASANKPYLEAGVGVVGHAYLVAVDGVQKAPSGQEVEYHVGDTVFYANGIWHVVCNADDVTSVFGRKGHVVALDGDYTVSQVTHALSDVLPQANIFVGSVSGIATGVPVSGDVTVLASGEVRVKDSAVSNSKLSAVAPYTWKGNNTNASSSPIDVPAGNLSEANSSVLSIVGSHSILSDTSIEVKKASASQDGYLSKGDWSTFNGKQNQLSVNNAALKLDNSVLEFQQANRSQVFAAPSDSNGVPSFRSLQWGDLFSALFNGSLSSGMMVMYDGLKLAATSGFNWINNILSIAGPVHAKNLAISEVGGYQGVAVLGQYGRVIVNSPAVSKTARIYVTVQSPIGAVGFQYISERVYGENFTIQSSSVMDRSVVAWLIVESDTSEELNKWIASN